VLPSRLNRPRRFYPLSELVEWLASGRMIRFWPNHLLSIGPIETSPSSNPVALIDRRSGYAGLDHGPVRAGRDGCRFVPWLYIHSVALQDIAFHLTGTPRIVCIKRGCIA